MKRHLLVLVLGLLLFSFLLAQNVTVNEFMADNDNVVMDPAGDYDDWVELYNCLDTEVDLSGYFLSDDAVEPDQWVFPDGTVIGAGAFLCIWADDDEDQEGLHANFKLSAGGESVVISDPQLTIIDQIDFPEQTTDLSYGRYPDGTGDFRQMTPTFMLPNLEGVGNNEDNIPAGMELRNFPNPFNPRTTIAFRIAEAGYTVLKVYDIKGRMVKCLISGQLTAGEQRTFWDGTDEAGKQVSSGYYFYQLRSGRFCSNGKMILLK